MNRNDTTFCFDKSKVKRDLRFALVVNGCQLVYKKNVPLNIQQYFII